MSLPAPARPGADFTTVTADGHLISGTHFPAIGGRAEGEPPRNLVLVHSLAMTRGFWTPVIDRLPSDIAIVAYDCRGHGASVSQGEAPPVEGYAIADFGRDLAAVLDELGWDHGVVAGASMGGAVAMAFAELQPERVSGIGLFDTTAWYGEGAALAWEERAGKALKEGMGALVTFQKTRWFTDRFATERPEVVEAHVATFLRNDLACFVATCRMLGAADLRPGLAKLTMPAVVVVGEEDYATPLPMAQALADALPQAQLHVVPDARHFTPAEAADATAELLLGLIERVRSTESASL